MRRLSPWLRGGSGDMPSGGNGEGHHRIWSLPVFRIVRQGRGLLHPVGLCAEVRGRYRADRQALPAAGRPAQPEKAAKILKYASPQGKIVEKMRKNTLQS